MATTGIKTDTDYGGTVKIINSDPANVLPATGTPRGQQFTATDQTAFRNGYVTGGYDAAGNGNVGLVMMAGGFEGPEGSFGWLTPNNQVILDNMVYQNDIPPLVIINLHSSELQYADFSTGYPSAIIQAAIKGAKAQYSKISSDPRYLVLSGASTNGASAFDTAFTSPTVVRNALVGSGSYVCFMANASMANTSDDPAMPQGYAKLVRITSPLPQIRVAGTVGTCDITGTNEEWSSRGCGGSANIDASQCLGDWLTINQDATKAFNETGIPASLVIDTKGTHTFSTWTFDVPDRLRFLFAPITCGCSP